MRLLGFLLFLVISQLAYSTKYYVASNGTDGSYPDRGTFEKPWKTWHYAFNNVTPSDTVYFRGGVYDAYSTSIGAQLVKKSVSGTKTSPTCFFAYPDDWAAGNYPILDCQKMYGWPRYGIEIASVENVHIKGLHVRNVRQTIAADYSWNRGIYIWSQNHSSHASGYHPNNITLENCVVYNIEGPGISKAVADTAYFINCDVYNICDTLTTYDPGGSGTGMGSGGVADRQDDAGASYAYFYGCRAWNCSDQGFGGNSMGTTIFENCWSLNNGNNPFITNVANKGSGWKFWYWDAAKVKNPEIVQLTMHNCIAAHNAFCGINWTSDREMPEIRAHIYNNFIYNNTYEVYNWGDRWGYNVWDEANIDTVGRWDHLYYNNLSYVNPVYRDDVRGVFSSSTNNLFNVAGTPVTDSYFISLDTTGMLGVHTRKADGSLPDTDFGKPAPGSPLIDAGVQVFGITFNGTAPDIGWAESGTATSTPAVPLYVSSVIQNATPARLEISFNLTLSNIIPATSAFAVTVNGSARAVSSVSVSGTKVMLTLASPVVYGNTVTVAYTKPASNPIQTAAGGQAASFTAKSVTNNVTAVIPTYVSSVVENAVPARIDVTFNLTLANIIPASSAFTVLVNGSVRAVSSVSLSGTKVLLTLASPVVYGNTVTVAYTKPASNPIQTAAGGQAASFTAKSVTNNVTAVNQPPSVEISSPTKSTTFVAPANITITAVASDPNGSIVKVEFYQGIVKLGELTSAPYSYTWKEVPEGTYSITVAATDNQNLRTVSTAVTVVVEKSSTQINQLPVVNITIPNNKKPKKHDNLVIVAEATDPDGAVAKVELKNGDVIIAEITTAPYVFTLRDVDTGTYLFTAIATDNLGAINYSQTVELRVDEFYDGDSEIIRLYPNPSDGKFKIDIIEDLPDEDNRISIFTSTGMIIYKYKILVGENPIEVDLNNTAPGTYIVVITSGKAIIATKKFLISR